MAQDILSSDAGHYLWLINALWIPLLISAWKMYGKQSRIFGMSESTLKTIKELKTMLEHPDDYGFGSTMTNIALNRLTDSTDKQNQLLDKVDRALDKTDQTQQLSLRTLERLMDRIEAAPRRNHD